MQGDNFCSYVIFGKKRDRGLLIALMSQLKSHDKSKGLYDPRNYDLNGNELKVKANPAVIEKFESKYPNLSFKKIQV